MRAVHVQGVQPDREELHDLARVVLVRELARFRVRFVANESQVSAHERGGRHLAQNVAVVAKRVGHKDVVVGAPQLVLLFQRAKLARHQDL